MVASPDPDDMGKKLSIVYGQDKMETDNGNEVDYEVHLTQIVHSNTSKVC